MVDSARPGRKQYGEHADIGWRIKMFLSASDNASRNYRVQDVDTGKFIKGVIYCDEETGEIKRYVFDRTGKVVWDNPNGILVGSQPFPRVVIEKRNIKLVRK